jgi:DHA2 family multidrug resistance protein
VAVTFLIGFGALLAFALVELFVAPQPLLDLRLFKDRVFAIANLIGWVSVLALFGAEFLMPLYLQSLRGFTALETGFLLLPLAITAGITLPIAGRIYDRIGPRPLLIVGFALLAFNTNQLSHLGAATSVQLIVGLLVIRGQRSRRRCRACRSRSSRAAPLSPMRRARSCRRSASRFWRPSW